MTEETEKSSIDWKQNLILRSHFLLDRSLSDPSNGLSITGHHDRRPIIFLPVNHEGLHISAARTVSDHEERPNNQSSSPTNDFDRVVTQVTPCWRRGLHLSGSKLIKIGFWFRCIASRAGLLLKFQFPSAAGVTPVVMSLLVVLTLFKLWRQWGLRRSDESRNHLKRLIQEKDEKINQLLRQISEMNQVFLALHET